MSAGMNPLDNNTLDYTEFVKSNQLDNNSLLYIVSLNYIRSDNNSRLCMSKASRTLNQLDKIVRQYTGRVLQGLNSNIQLDTKFVKSNQLGNSFRQYIVPVMLVLYNSTRQHNLLRLYGKVLYTVNLVNTPSQSLHWDNSIPVYTLVVYNRFQGLPI
jgi:hypothetical protein